MFLQQLLRPPLFTFHLAHRGSTMSDSALAMMRVAIKGFLIRLPCLLTIISTLGGFASFTNLVLEVGASPKDTVVSRWRVDLKCAFY